MKCINPSVLPSGLVVPCGKCIGCRLNRINVLTMRCVHEASMFSSSSVVTLTYAHAPKELCKSDFERFWLSVTRWMKRHKGYKPKMIVSGEYGETFGRPHFHACCFGISPAEMRFLCDKFWSHGDGGFVRIDRFSRRAAEYTIEYLCKSDLDPDDERAPMFVTFSRGLGFDWLRKNFDRVVKDGFISYETVKMAIPPSYLQFINRKLNHSSKYVKLEDSCPEYKAFRERLDLANFDSRVAAGSRLSLPEVDGNEIAAFRVRNNDYVHSNEDIAVYLGMEYIEHDFSLAQVVDHTAHTQLKRSLYGCEDLQ